MIAASSRAEFSLKRLSFFPEPALIYGTMPLSELKSWEEDPLVKMTLITYFS